MPSGRPKGSTNEYARHIWTVDDDAVLRVGFEKGIPAIEIANSLKISRRAVYTRAHKLGFPHKAKNRSLEERFLQFIHPEPNSGCWLWTGAISSDGYGYIRDGDGGKKPASHVALMLYAKAVPAGLQACHRCDNPYCANPDHLFVGTHKENTADKMAKGRWRGPDHPITIALWRKRLATTA